MSESKQAPEGLIIPTKDEIRVGLRTSELLLSGLCGFAIVKLAEVAHDPYTKAAACLGLAWIAGQYTTSRVKVKIAKHLK